MPYIAKEPRKWYAPDAPIPAREYPGILNYQVTVLVDRFIEQNGLSYTTVNAAIGALECAKLELYRRLAAPYEDQKINENGDVYHVSKSDEE